MCLETSPEAAPTDRYLCHLVWTHRLAEEVGIQFSIDDPSSALNISDQQTQYALRGFERNLAKYRAAVPPDEQKRTFGPALPSAKAQLLISAFQRPFSLLSIPSIYTCMR